jgi:hypothetical protein
MPRRTSGPRRSSSVESYLRETRVGAALALLALAAAIGSEQFAEHVWERHTLLAGLTSSAIVVMLSVAVVNEVLEFRRSRRWTVLAQYVMLELVRDARMFWTGMLELAGLMPADANEPAAMSTAAGIVRDTPRMTEAIHGIVSDARRRRELREAVAAVVLHNDEVLGRWAAVMLNADVYAEVVDRHVELAGDLAWLNSLLEESDPTTVDPPRRQRARSHPAVLITGQLDDDALTRRLVSITQLAEQLDRGTLDLALKIVPITWWEERLDRLEPAPDTSAETNGRAQMSTAEDAA